jgi:membrane-bound ClpP family serine protease
VNADPGFFTRLLNAVIDPNILPLLFLAGIAGDRLRDLPPGGGAARALGAVALLTALFRIRGPADQLDRLRAA